MRSAEAHERLERLWEDIKNVRWPRNDPARRKQQRASEFQKSSARVIGRVRANISVRRLGVRTSRGNQSVDPLRRLFGHLILCAIKFLDVLQVLQETCGMAAVLWTSCANTVCAASQGIGKQAEQGSTGKCTIIWRVRHRGSRAWAAAPGRARGRAAT